MSRVVLFFVLAVGAAGEAPQAFETHPFSVHDMLAMKRISDPQVSPNGRWIVFVLRITDLGANRGSTDLWIVGSDGKGLHRLTTHPASDHSPLWTPDSAEVLFLSSRSGTSQVWRIGLAGGEARQVTDLPLDVGALTASPDAVRLALALEVFPDCEDLDCTVKRLKKHGEKKESGVPYEQLFVRHWDTWKDGRRSHIFVVPADGGKAVDLMQGMDADSPSKPFGGREEIAFAPDGKSLVFTARTAGAGEPWSTDFNLYQAPVDGRTRPRNLTASNPAWDTSPIFSADGKTLAYLAMKRSGYEADRYRVVLMAWPEGTTRVLTEDWDRSPSGISWSPEGGALFAAAQNLGQRSIFRIDVASGKVQTLLKDGYNSVPGTAGDRLVFGRDDLSSPVELYSMPLSGGDPTPLTSINQEVLSEVRLGEAEQFTFEGWGGETVYGYLVKPVDFDTSKRYPVAFLIHGGPQSSFGNHFHYRWNPQAYAGAGYAALMIDFHGSTGYGQEFTDSIGGDWGGKPLEDLQKGLQAALDRYPFLDGGRVGALGASYGGYMINWIAGNWIDRFRCLVNHDGVFDMRSMYYTTEELWFPEWGHGGPYCKNTSRHEKHNPANHVENWTAPMLVVHGAEDHRVPLGQGLGAFTALQRQNIPSRFLYFPDENHWILKPHNSIQWHREVLAWLDRWLKD